MSTMNQHVDGLVNQADKIASDAGRVGREAVDKFVSTAHHWRDEAAPAVNRMRRSVAQASDRTIGYARHEPVRTVLMVAVAGAMLYAAVRFFSGRKDH